jgi:hypothetical protein
MTAPGVHAVEIKRFFVILYMFLNVNPGSHVELEQSGIQFLKQTVNAGSLAQFVTRPDHHVQIRCALPSLTCPELKKLIRPLKNGLWMVLIILISATTF